MAPLRYHNDLFVELCLVNGAEKLSIMQPFFDSRLQHLCIRRYHWFVVFCPTISVTDPLISSPNVSVTSWL